MEKAVAGVLNKVLGDWIEDLNSEQLNLSVWSGKIRLGPIRVKSTIVDKLGVPFRVRLGTVRSIAVDVDWMKLTTKPLVIDIEDVFLLCSTRASSDWSESQELSTQQSQKSSSLDQYELLSSLPASAEPGFIEKLVSKIVDNIQVRVAGVYIRLEDDTASIAPYAIGVVLGRVEAVTCSKQWKPQFLEDSRVTYKKVRVESLALFLDYGDEKETEEQVFVERAKEETKKPMDHSYILAPADVEVKAVLRKDTEGYTKPELDVSVLVGAGGPIQLSIETPQLTHSLKLAEFYSAFTHYQAGVLAKILVVEWSETDQQSYRNTYKAWVTAGKKQSGEVFERLTEMERCRTYEAIVTQRTVALEELKLEQEKAAVQVEIEHQSSPSSVSSSLKHFFSWGLSNTESERSAKLAQAERDLSRIESSERELLQRSKTGTVDVRTNKQPAEFVKFRVVADMPQFAFCVKDERRVLVTLEQEGLSVELGLRPSTMAAKVRIGSVSLVDNVINSASFPYIMQVGTFEGVYDQSPSDVTDVKLRAERLTAVANFQCLTVVAKAVGSSLLQEFDVDYYRKAASDTVASYVREGQLYMEELVKGNYTHQAFNIDAHIEAPRVIVPLDIRKKELCLVADFGVITASSRLAPKRNPAFDYSKIVDESLLYDFYTVEIAAMRVGVQWEFPEPSLRSEGRFSPLFVPSTIEVVVGNAIARDQSGFPGLLGRVMIQEMAFALSDQQMLMLLQLQAKVNEEMQKLPSASESHKSQQVQSEPVEATEVQSFSEKVRKLDKVLAQHFELTIGCVSFALEKKNQQLAALAIAPLQVNASIDEAGTISSVLEIGEITLKDRRPDVDFSSVISKPAGREPDPDPSEESQNPAQVRIQLHANISDNFIEALLSLTNLRVIATCDFLNALVQFPTEAFEAIEEESRLRKLAQESQFTKLFTAGFAKHMQTMREARVTQYYTTRRCTLATVVVQGVELWVPEGTPQARGKVVNVYVDSVVRYNSRQTYKVHMDAWGAVVRTETVDIDDEANLSVDKVGVVIGNVKEDKVVKAIEDREELLKPSRLSLDYTVSQRNTASVKTAIDAQFESLDVVLGFRDIVLLQSVSSQWSTFSSQSPTAQVSTQQSTASLTTEEYLIDVKLASVEATMMDDTGLHALALFYLELNNVSAALEFSAERLIGNVACGLKVNYYNPSVACWEPIVEEWAVEVHAKQEDAGKQIEAIVRSETTMNINLSYMMGETAALASQRLSEGAESWGRENAQSSEAESNAFSGTQVVYKLKNRLGTKLSAWIERGKATDEVLLEGQISQSSEVWTIAPGKSKRFGQSQVDRVQAEKLLFGKRKYASMLQNVQTASTIAVSIDGIGTVGNVIIDDLGTKSVNVRSAPSPVTLVVNISSKEGLRLVSLESVVKVVNNTDMTLQVRHREKGEVVGVGRALVVPVDWLIDGQDTSLVTDDGLVNLLTSSGIITYGVGKKLSIDFAVIQSGNTDLETAENTPHQKVIIINSPYTLQNLTPGVLSLYYENESEPSCTINPGGSSYLYSNDPSSVLPHRWVLQLDRDKKLETGFVTPRKKLEHYHLTGDIPADKLSIEATEMAFVKSKDWDLKSTEIVEEQWHGLFVQVYCQFWIVNRTPFTLEFTGKRDYLKIPRNSVGTVKDKKSQMRVRLAKDDFGVESEWSKPFNIRTVDIAGSLLLNNSEAVNHSENAVPNIVQLGVKLEKASWPMVKSVIVRIQSRFVITNFLSYKVYVRQHKKERTMKLKQGQSVPYQLENAKVGRAIEISRDKVHWSSPFNIEDVDDIQVRYKDAKAESSSQPASPIARKSALSIFSLGRTETDWWKPSSTNEYWSYARVIVATEDEATLFISLTEPVDPEYKIDNKTDEELRVNQVDCDLVTVVKPHSHIYFAYDNHLLSTKKVRISLGSASAQYSLDKIKVYKSLLAGQKVEVATVGITRVLSVRPDTPPESQSITDSSADCQVDIAKWVNSKFRFQNFQAKVALKGLVVSLIDERPKELFVFSLLDIDVKVAQKRFLTGKVSQKLKVLIGTVQLDDMQAKGSQFPVMLCHYFRSKEESEQPVPFLQFRVEKDSLVAKRSGGNAVIEHYKHVGLLIQPILVQVHQETITGLLGVTGKLQKAFSKNVKANSEVQECVNFMSINSDLNATDLQPIFKGGQPAMKTYFEFVNLSSMKVLLSFRSARSKSSFKIDPREAFGFLNILTSIAGAFVNITESSLHFSNVILLHSFQTFDIMTWTITKNYIRQGALQFYKVLGSSDMIGNPIGLIDKLGTGVFEFFNEPRKGLLKGPKSFAEGIGKGVKSLVSGVISGGFGSVSRITGSLYSVVRQVGGDEDNYDRINRTDNIAEGIYHGVKGGLQDLAEGVTGLFMKPFHGAKAGGVTGFLKGVGTGLLGVATAPLSAVLRVGTSVTAGIANTATLLRTGKIQQKGRVRFPRQISARKVIEAYHEEIAQAQELLKTLKAHQNEQLMFYLRIDEVTIVLVTTHHALEIYKGDLKTAINLFEIFSCEIHCTQSSQFILFASTRRKQLVLSASNYSSLSKLYGVFSVCSPSFNSRKEVQRSVKVRISRS